MTIRYYQAVMINKKSEHEADSLSELQDKIIEYYLDGYEFGETAIPEVFKITRFENDEEHVFLGSGVKSFNEKMSEIWKEKTAAFNEPSDYQEHNTLWGMK